MAEESHVRIAAATGGQMAIRLAKRDSVRLVVAVACGKELRKGILSVFPKAVLGVPIWWPEGPCRDTDVDLEEVREALEAVLARN